MRCVSKDGPRTDRFTMLFVRPLPLPTLRDAALWAAPQGEAVLTLAPMRSAFRQE